MRAYVITPAAGPRQWVATQKEATDHGGKWERVDIPDDKPGQLTFLNAIEARASAPAPTAAEEPPAPPAPPVAPPTGDLTADAIEERILEASPASLARFLMAAINRLGEHGRTAWPHVSGLMIGKRPGASEERGLRFLALAQIAQLNGEGQ